MGSWRRWRQRGELSEVLEQKRVFKGPDRLSVIVSFVSHSWQPGDSVLVRDVYRDRIRAAVPTTVVAHDQHRTVLYLPVGTPFCLPADRDGTLTKDLTRFDHLTRLEWDGYEQLLIAVRDESHACIARWNGKPRRFVDWYVNLQAPLRPSRYGFDTTDHALDLVISADLTSYTWKDEEQLADLVADGYFSATEAAAFYEEGERAIFRARAGAPPFREGWEHWRPDPVWSLPRLPSDWDEL